MRIRFFLILIIGILSLSTKEIASANPVIVWSQLTTDPVQKIEWDPRGERIAVSSLREHSISIFNLNTKSYDWRIELPDDSYTSFLRWSPNGAYIAAAVDGDIYLFDAEQNEDENYQIFSSDLGYYPIVRWSPDSNRVATLASGYIEIFDIVSGTITQTIDLGEHYEITSPAFDWSPNGEIFAAPYYSALSFGSNKSFIGFWDAGGNLINTYLPQNQTEYRSGEFCYNYGEENGDLLSLEWASDSKSLAVSGYDGYGICILGNAPVFETHTIGNDFTSLIRWSPDQQWLVRGSFSGTEAWSCFVSLTAVSQGYTTTDEALSTDDCNVESLTWSPDSSRLAVGTSDGIWIGTLIGS